MSKTLLVLGAGRDQLFMIRTARLMGLRVIALDQNSDSPGFPEADFSAVVSTRDLPAMLEFVDNYQENFGPIHGVSTMGSDIPQMVGALARYLGTPTISERSAHWATEKYEMKERFRQAGVRVPWFQLVNSASAVREFFAERGGPMVLKPVDQAGSRGVSLLQHAEEAERLFAHAFENSGNGGVLLEDFVPGAQLSTESIMMDGDIYTLGYADRNYEQMRTFLPHIIENGGWVPSVYEDQRRLVETEIKKAALALNINDGVIKGDVVLASEGPVIIEIAARLSGGDFSESLVPLGTGINYVETVIRLALGERPNIKALLPKSRQVVANRYFFAKPGMLEKVRGIDRVSDLDWIAKLELWYQPGDVLPDISNHGQRTGVFVVTGPDRKTVQERIDSVYQEVEFEISPVV